MATGIGNFNCFKLCLTDEFIDCYQVIRGEVWDSFSGPGADAAALTSPFVDAILLSIDRPILRFDRFVFVTSQAVWDLR